MTAEIIKFPEREKKYTFSDSIVDIRYDTGRFHLLCVAQEEKSSLLKRFVDSIKIK